MKAIYSEKKEIKNNVNNNSYIEELCHQSPFLVINTPCGIGKYKFNKIGYDDNKNLVLEYVLIDDESPVLHVGGEQLLAFVHRLQLRLRQERRAGAQRPAPERHPPRRQPHRLRRRRRQVSTATQQRLAVAVTALTVDRCCEQIQRQLGLHR